MVGSNIVIFRLRQRFSVAHLKAGIYLCSDPATHERSGSTSDIHVVRAGFFYLEWRLHSVCSATFHVAPGPAGEIMIDLRKNGHSVEILFYPEKTTYVFFPAAGNPEQGVFQLERLPEILNRLNAS